MWMIAYFVLLLVAGASAQQPKRNHPCPADWKCFSFVKVGVWGQAGP